MSDHIQPENNEFDVTLDQRLIQLGREFKYPATPNMAGTVRSRLSQPARPSTRLVLVRAAIIILLLLCALLAVPEVRAAIRDFIQIGVVRIFFGAPTPTVTPSSNATPVPTPISSLRDLAGRTTLAEARQQFKYTILLPAYPADLGEPDEVFLQNYIGDFVVLVWLDDKNPENVGMTLHILSPDVDVNKSNVRNITEAKVNGEFAIWGEGPYLVQIKRDNREEHDIRQLVKGNILIWFDTENQLTYRLESTLTMEEAVRMAESLR